LNKIVDVREQRWHIFSIDKQVVDISFNGVIFDDVVIDSPRKHFVNLPLEVGWSICPAHD